MTNKPSYTITIKTADYLTKIAETVTRLEYGTGFKRDIKLHRKNRVRSIQSSLAIEGNTLSIDEVTAVIEGKPVAGNQAEVREVKNAYEAYDKIMTFDPYTVKDFLKAHKLMTDRLVKESGKFRSGDVGVFDDDVVVHMGARPQFVPQLIKELFEWAKTTELHPVLKGAIVHCEIETIHPLADGNGRMGRLWQTLILAKWNEVFAWIPMESLVYEKRPQYYDALQNAQKLNDSGEFIEFALSAILGAVEIQAKQISEPTSGIVSNEKKLVNEFAENVDEFVEKFVDNETQRSILRLLIAQPTISAKRIAAEVGMSSRGVQKSIDVLKKRGFVKRIGSAKGGHWLVKKPD
jgi:Fic family protein